MRLLITSDSKVRPLGVSDSILNSSWPVAWSIVARSSPTPFCGECVAVRGANTVCVGGSSINIASLSSLSSLNRESRHQSWLHSSKLSVSVPHCSASWDAFSWKIFILSGQLRETRNWPAPTTDILRRCDSKNRFPTTTEKKARYM